MDKRKSKRPRGAGDELPKEKDSWRELMVVSKSNNSQTPPVTDPRELQTILTCSLRALFGALETHSCFVEITQKKRGRKKTEQGTDGDNDQELLVIRCHRESVSAVRAALTMVTPPPYLESMLYRFDVVEE